MGSTSNADGVSIAYAEVSIGTPPRGGGGEGDLAAWKLAIRGGASRWCDARGGAYRFPGDGGKTRRPGLGMSSGEGL